MFICGSPVWLFKIAILAAALLSGQAAGETMVLASRSLDAQTIHGKDAPALNYEFSLHAVVLAGAGWHIEEVAARIKGAAGILRQCGVSIYNADITLISAPDNMRNFASPFTDAAVELAQRFSSPTTPVIYFVDSVRDGDIAFAARYTVVKHLGLHPALQDSIWITQALKRSEEARNYMRYYFSAHDVVAHEIAHFLGDLGHVHPTRPNLMHQSVAYLNNSLTRAQCRAIRTRNIYVRIAPSPAFHAGTSVTPTVLLPSRH